MVIKSIDKEKIDDKEKTYKENTSNQIVNDFIDKLISAAFKGLIRRDYIPNLTLKHDADGQISEFPDLDTLEIFQPSKLSYNNQNITVDKKIKYENSDGSKRYGSLSRFFKENAGIIAEYKPSSPANNYNFGKDISIIRQYQDSGACAVSILTMKEYFSGNPKNLIEAKNYTTLPLLMKDIIVSKEQIDFGYNSGCDMILLICGVLDRLEIDYAEYIDYAHDKEIEVLLEAGNPEEYKRAMETDADIIGINNRNLATLEIDTNTTPKIIKEHGKKKPVLSLSGLNNGKDVERMILSGADGCLVGSVLMGSDNTKNILEEMVNVCKTFSKSKKI